MTARSALVWMTHLWDRDIANEFESILHTNDPDVPEVWLMPDSKTPGAADLARRYRRCHVIEEQEVLRRFPYPHPKGGRLHDNVHLGLVDFYVCHPEYDFYWLVEFDVRYTGNWAAFLNSFGTDCHDLVTCHIRRTAEEPLWWLWDTLTHPQKTIARTDCLRSFNVIYRISRRALSLIRAAQEDGWRGHPEVLLPTLLHTGGCSLLDFGGNGPYASAGMQNRVYTSGGRADGSLNPFCTVRFRPSRVRAGIRRNKIYHPVKPAAAMEPLRARIRYFWQWTLGYCCERLTGRHRNNACGMRRAHPATGCSDAGCARRRTR